MKRQLFNLLAEADSLAELGGRIYPGTAPGSAALPFVVYDVTANEHVRHLAGGSGLCRSTVAFRIYHRTASAAAAVADAMRRVLDNRRGWVADLWVFSAAWQTDDDSFLPAADAGELGTHVLGASCTVSFTEPAITNA